jgi:hypothetical protein
LPALGFGTSPTDFTVLRSHTAKVVGDPQLAATLGAAANGASIEALIYGEQQAASTFDRLIGSLLVHLSTDPTVSAARPLPCTNVVIVLWRC